MKKILAILFIASFVIACGGDKDSSGNSTNPPKSMIPDDKPDDGKGIGEFKDVKLNSPLDATMVADGQAIYDLKCSACHKLGAKRVVGPGFKGVTERRKPEWILNMVTNVEIMLDEDPAAQKLLEECLTRMPNQNLSAADARAVLEFLYSNEAG